MKQPPKKEFQAIWYAQVNIFADIMKKTVRVYHLCYNIMKTDLTQMSKRIIGILYNEQDKDLLYFQVVIPLSENFTVEYLIDKHINTNKYRKDLSKQVLLADPQKKKVLEQVLNTLKTKVTIT